MPDVDPDVAAFLTVGLLIIIGIVVWLAYEMMQPPYEEEEE